MGQTKAAQALAKITITSNPEMAFPGERVSAGAGGWVCQAGAHVGAAVGIDSVPCVLSPQIYEVVRPLVSLLHLQRTGLENFEGLMALTNLAGISERLRWGWGTGGLAVSSDLAGCPGQGVLTACFPPRQKILKERAVPMIEGYMFEEHELIRLAATECMCNMAMSKEVKAGMGWGLCWAAGPPHPHPNLRPLCRCRRCSWLRAVTG